jgi:hypothetical protein
MIVRPWSHFFGLPSNLSALSGTIKVALSHKNLKSNVVVFSPRLTAKC